MGKTRVGVILREGMGSKSSTANQSADLKALHDKYTVFCKNIRSLALALQHHLGSLQQMEKTRSMLSKSFAQFSKNTPLWDSVGQMPDADHPVDTVCSYASVYDTLSAKSKSFAEKYQQFVVSYVIEWEKTVTTRVGNGLKKVEEQRRELNHYQKKVEALRLSTNKQMAQGKSVKSDVAEKLKRNEEKLVGAKELYNKMSTQLCILMEEVSERAWRDLHPLLVKAVQFDMTMSSDEAKILASFSKIVSQLKTIANANGIPAQPRLKDLGTLNAELLSTRPGGVQSLAIDAASAATSPLSAHSTTSPLFGTSPTNFDMPPGTVGPQGMGGFPVRVASASNLQTPDAGSHQMSRASSFSSYGSAPQPSTNFEPPSTLGMLTISQASAPAPTMDDLYGSSSSFSRPPIPPAPHSVNLPPLPPSAAYGQNRSTSMDSYGSGPAPPPAAAPPPPPAAAPPAPPGSFNNTSLVPSPSSAGAPSPYAMSSGYGDPFAPQQQQSPYGHQQQPPAQYGQPPPPQPYGQQYGQQQQYGQTPAPPPQQYGQPPQQQPNTTNPFGF